MLHLAIICMVCAVLAPIEGSALIGVNNNKSNIFCHADEREQGDGGKFFPGLYNADVKNSFDCAEKQVADRTNCILYNNFTNQCQFSETLCSFKNKFPDKIKRNSDSQLKNIAERKNIYGLAKIREKILKKLKSSNANRLEEPKRFVKLTTYERNKLRNLKRIGKKRMKRSTRKSHSDKVEIDNDSDMNKRIVKLVRRIPLENIKTEANSVVSPVTEPVSVTDVSTRLSQDSTKGIAFPFFNNIKQIFRFSKEYFNSKRNSQEKRDVDIPITTERSWNPENTITENEIPENSARVKRNVPRHFVHKNCNRLRGCSSTLSTLNRVAFSAVKRKRRRRKRDHRHHKPRLDSSSEQIWPLFNQTHSNDVPNYNGDDSNATGSQTPGNISSLVLTTVLPSFRNSSSIILIRSITDSESSREVGSTGKSDEQPKTSIRLRDKLNEYKKRTVFNREWGKAHRQYVVTRRRKPQNSHRALAFPQERMRLRPGKYLKIRHALRSYIRHNSDRTLKEKVLMDRKKRCEGKCNRMPHRCWRSAPLLCIPYIRKGQDELLKYIIKTLQNLLGKPMPRKIDVFEKIKFKPCCITPDLTCEDIMPLSENEPATETTVTTCASTTTTCKSNPPSSSPSTPVVVYQTDTTSSTFSMTTCPSIETVTSSFGCTIKNEVCPPPTTTCSPPVTCSPSTMCPVPSTIPTPSPSVPQNSCTIYDTAGSERIVTSSWQRFPNCDYTTEAPLSPGTGPSVSTSLQSQSQTTSQSQSISQSQSQLQSQTHNPIGCMQMTNEDEKRNVIIPIENVANTPSLKYVQTATMSSTNEVTSRILTQGYTTESPQTTTVSTQQIRPPTAQKTAQWYFSDIPVEKSEIFDCTSSTDPNLCYKFYQEITSPSSTEQPELNDQREMEKQQQQQQRQDVSYVYETEETTTQPNPTMWSSETSMPVEFDLLYNNKAKINKNFHQLNRFQKFGPTQEYNLRERNFFRSQAAWRPHGKFRFEEDDNLFPGDPFAFRYMDTTTDRFLLRTRRPRFHRKKFLQKINKKLKPNSDYDDDPFLINDKIYDKKYNRYPSEISDGDFDEKIKKNFNSQERQKRAIFYRDSYPEPKNFNNYDNYPDDSNYDEQYPENLLLPKLEQNHWARKREENQNSTTSGTYALFSELADIATLAPNETEKVSEPAVNTSSTESVNQTVTESQSPPRNGGIDKFETENRSSYDNSPNPNVSILSAGHTTTVKQIPATTSGEATPATLSTTTSSTRESTHALKSNEVEKAQIVDSGKPDKEVASNHDLEAGEDQIMTTLKTASIVKGPKKLFTKPTPKVYTKVYPDSLPNELETNETPTTTTTPKTDKTTVVQTLAAPDVRLQLLAVCEGYLEIVKLIKAQNQTLEEELDTDLSRYCENIISQSFNLQADNSIIKSKKPEKNSSSTTTTAQTASSNSNKLVSKRRSCDRYRSEEDGFNHQNLRAKVVVDILRSPIYKKDLAAYADQNNFYQNGRKTKRMNSPNAKADDKGMSSRKYKGRTQRDFSNSKVGLRNDRKKLRKKEEAKGKFPEEKISEEEMELLHLLRQRKRALLSWLSDPKENEIKPNDLEETDYLDDDEYYTITADTTEDSGTITPKGDQETSESTTETTFYTESTIFPVYAKQYGYDKGGELREVDVLWRRVNEETHEKKIFKNMSVLALLLTSTMAPYAKRKESRLAGSKVYDAEELYGIQSNRDNRAGLVDPSPSFKENPVTTSLSTSSPSTTEYSTTAKPEIKECCPTTTTAAPTASSTTCSAPTTPTTTPNAKSMPTTESGTIQPNNTSKKNQTYIFMRKPDPSTIVGSPPNSTRGHKNSTHKMSRKLELAKDFFQEYSIEFLNYAVYILPIMFTILFLMCCLCCFLQILNSRGGGRQKKKKKTILCTEEDFDTTGESENETKMRKKKKWKKAMKSNVDCENFENRRLRAFWNAIKINSRGKQRGDGDIHDETSTPTEKRRSFLQFLKGKKESVKPEELASLSYPPPCEVSEDEDRIRIEANNIDDESDSKIKVPVREKTEVDERREIISLLEELKKIELENLEEMKNKKSVCVQYMSQDDEKTVFKKPDIPSSYQVNKYFPSDPISDKRFPFRDDPNPEAVHEDAGELMELVPYEGEYAQRKSLSSVRRSDDRVNRGGRCERFFKMFRSSGDGTSNFMKSGNDKKSYTYTKYKNISTDTRDELMGGTHRNADVDNNLSDDMLDKFPLPYSLQRNREKDIVDEMENLKRQLNKKKNVRLKDNGVLCRL